MTDQEQIAAFLAKKGATRIPAGERTMDYRQMRAAVRGEQALIDERHVVVDHCGREHVRNGLGEWIG
jgi:hypothetical protein